MPRIDKLKYVRANDRVPVPRRGSEEAAGFDLGLPHDVRIRSKGHIFIDLGIAFDIPEGHYLKIVPRSSTCDTKNSQGVPNFEHVIVPSNIEGIIDSDYTGTIKVKLYNNGSTMFLGYAGDYVLQAILQEYTKVDQLEEVDEITKQTDRGDKGFGSSDETE